MIDEATVLVLEQGRWYAWEMLPGYTGYRYCSPIRIGRIEALKTGRDLLRLHFYNAFYAEGVRNFVTDLRILFRGPDYLLGNLVEGHRLTSTERCAIITPISHEWIARNCSHLSEHRAFAGATREADLDQLLTELL